MPCHATWPHAQVADAEVEKKGDGYVLKAEPATRVYARAHKMSKSRGNVINPDDVVAQYGADSLRLYEMFMGPLRDTKVGDSLPGTAGGAQAGSAERPTAVCVHQVAAQWRARYTAKSRPDSPGVRCVHACAGYLARMGGCA